jgi:CRP/FNR family nitrogen fixation transcriptional regulator
MLHWNAGTGSARNVNSGHLGPTAAVNSIADTISLMGACMTFERGAEVFAEEEPAEYVYKVVSGAVRLSKLMSDGRRQIGAFYLPGDIFGLDAEEIHSFSAETIADSQISLVKRSALLAEAMRDGDLARQLWVQTVGQVRLAQSHMLLLGRKNAQERIATFLLDMSARLRSAGQVELPMSRQDIADYLGLTIETVSRTLTQLERDRVISMPVSRRILLRDRRALDEMNDVWAA